MDWSFAKNMTVVVGFVALLIGLSTSCEWTSGGGVTQSNNNPSNIDISVAGVYRNPAGGVIVSSFEGTPGVASTPTTTNNVTRSGEVIAVGNGTSTSFSGTLAHTPIVAGSLTIIAPGFTLTDNGDGTLSGVAGSSGTINYSTGTFSLNFGGTALESGVDVTASYTSQDITEGTSGSSGSTPPASSRTKIFTFNVEQNGNSIRITDNNADTYDGTVGTAQITSQSSINADQQQLDEVYQFSAEGNSGGVKVKMVGSFSAGVTVFFASGASVSQNGTNTTGTSTLVETFRTISLSVDGTWIEADGVTGDIQAIGPQNEKVEIIPSSSSVNL